MTSLNSSLTYYSKIHISATAYSMSDIASDSYGTISLSDILNSESVSHTTVLGGYCYYLAGSQSSADVYQMPRGNEIRLYNKYSASQLMQYKVMIFYV